MRSGLALACVVAGLAAGAQGGLSGTAIAAGTVDQSAKVADLAGASDTRALKPGGYDLEADVSTRIIPVGADFSGAHVVIFGSVNTPRQVSPGLGPLDVVAVIQGQQANLTVRKKERRAGVWLNTRSVEFEQVPRYYAMLSTRPLAAIASKAVLDDNGIGFAHIPISTALSEAAGIGANRLSEFRDAAVDLGVRDKHYVERPGSIEFLGKSLFRGDIELPSNVPVGVLDVRLLLFRGGAVMARYDTKVAFARAGVEHIAYRYARERPLLYGLATIAIGCLIGALSSALVTLRRR